MADPGSNAAGPDIEGLKAFLDVSDRDVAMFFVGRVAEIAAVEKTCANAFAAVKRGKPASSTTLLFQGAPGAGKTSLLSHLVERWSKRDTPVTGLRISQITFANPEELATAVAEAVGEKTDEIFRETRTMKTEYGGNVSVASIRRGHEKTTVPRAPSLPALAKRYPPAEWSAPLCLMVDEVQVLDPSNHGPVLLDLHGGVHGLPIVPVYVGLGDSRDKLGECGLTRFSHGHVFTMGALAEEDAGTAVGMFLEDFRISASAGASDWWSEQLASRSDS